jgi:outer membrane receptor for ferrienterochelin and colicins
MMTLRSSVTASLALVLTLPLRASAEDLSDLAGLLNEPVVSTASKTAETADLAPATTSIITAEDLRRYGLTSLADAINFISVGMLTEASYATPEIGARGVLLSGDYGNHVLLLLDGHVLNEPWDGTAYYDVSAGIPLDLVDHIEVILGPGSVLYGSNAMLGVINVITKHAKDYAGMHLIAEGGLPEAWHLAGGYGQAFEWFGHAGELTAAVDYTATRGPSESYPVESLGGTTWGGNASHRAIDVPAGYLRFILGDFELSLRAAESRRAATLIMGDFDDPNNWERDRWLSFDARYAASLSAKLRLSVRLYGDYYDYLQNAPSASASLDCEGSQSSCVYRNSGVSRWAGTEVSGTYDWFGDGTYVTLVGTDIRYEKVTSFVAYDDAAEGLSTTPSSYDKDDTVVGAYLQQTARPASFLSLNAGLRLDHDPEFGSHLSPRVAAVVPAWPGGTVKAIYSTAFRAPSFYERFYSDATEQLGAPNLKPETVESLEGVVEQKLGADRVRLSVFSSWWDDLVVTVPASPTAVQTAMASGQLSAGAMNVLQYENASRVDSYGLNLDLEGSALLQKLRYGAGLTLADTSSDGGNLAAAAQVFGNARVAYDLGGSLPVLALAARVEGPRPVSGTEFTPVPYAPTHVELRGTVSGPLSGGLSYRLSASVARYDTSAYAVGPLDEQSATYTSQTLLLLPRYQVLLGLRYER